MDHAVGGVSPLAEALALPANRELAFIPKTTLLGQARCGSISRDSTRTYKLRNGGVFGRAAEIESFRQVAHSTAPSIPLIRFEQQLTMND